MSAIHRVLYKCDLVVFKKVSFSSGTRHWSREQAVRPASRPPLVRRSSRPLSTRPGRNQKKVTSNKNARKLPSTTATLSVKMFLWKPMHLRVNAWSLEVKRAGGFLGSANLMWTRDRNLRSYTVGAELPWAPVARQRWPVPRSRPLWALTPAKVATNTRMPLRTPPPPTANIFTLPLQNLAFYPRKAPMRPDWNRSLNLSPLRTPSPWNQHRTSARQ